MARPGKSRPVGIRREMASGAVRSIGGQAGTAVFGVAVYIFLARLLSPSGMGSFLSVTTVVAFAGLAAGLGLGPILTRAIATESSSGDMASVRSAVKRAAVAVAAASAVLALLAWAFLTQVVGHGSVVSSAPLLAIGILGLWIYSFAMEGVIADGFRGLGEIGHSMWVVRLAPLAISTGAFAVMYGFGIHVSVAGAVLVVAGSSMAVTVTGFLLLLSRIRGHSAPAGSGSAIPLRQALPVWISSLGAYASSNLGLWAVVILGTAVEVADYGLAARIVAPIAIPLAAVNGFMMPIIASLHARGDRATLERTLRSTTTVSSVLSLVGAVLLVALAPFLLRVLFGPEYVDASVIVAILAIAAVVNVLTGSAGATLLMSGHQRVFAEITVVALATGVVLVTLGYLQAGIVGVAIATSLVMSVRSVAMMLVAHHRVGVWTVAYLRPRDAIAAIRSLGATSAVTARWRTEEPWPDDQQTESGEDD